MITKELYEICKRDSLVRRTKIENLTHAVKETEKIISESKLSEIELIFLRKKIAETLQDIEILNLLN